LAAYGQSGLAGLASWLALLGFWRLVMLVVDGGCTGGLEASAFTKKKISGWSGVHF